MKKAQWVKFMATALKNSPNFIRVYTSKNGVKFNYIYNTDDYKVIYKGNYIYLYQLNDGKLIKKWSFDDWSVGKVLDTNLYLG